MKLLAKQVRNGIKKDDGKPWEMTICHVQTEEGAVHEIVLFNAGHLPEVQPGDSVEPIYELRADFKTKKVTGQVIGFKKAKA